MKWYLIDFPFMSYYLIGLLAINYRPGWPLSNELLHVWPLCYELPWFLPWTALLIHIIIRTNPCMWYCLWAYKTDIENMLELEPKLLKPKSTWSQCLLPGIIFFVKKWKIKANFLGRCSTYPPCNHLSLFKYFFYFNALKMSNLVIYKKKCPAAFSRTKIIFGALSKNWKQK